MAGSSIKAGTMSLAAVIPVIICITFTTAGPLSPEMQNGSCGVPPEKEHASHNATGKVFANLTRVVYTCRIGYYGKGIRFTICMNGNWLEHPAFLFICKLKVCSPPPRLLHGRKDGFVYSVGSTVRYSCDRGYELRGAAISVCLVDTNWSGRKPSCVPLQCPRLEAPAHGSVEAEGVLYDSVARVVCDKGYSLTGPESRVCGEDKTWSGETNTCVEIQCGPLNIPNVKHNVDKRVEYLYIAEFSCEDGKTLNGIATSFCIGQDKWSQDFPECIDRLLSMITNPAHTCLVPTIENGVVQKRDESYYWYPKYTEVTVDRVETDTKLYVKCDWRYSLDGGNGNEMRCEQGKWDQTLQCIVQPCNQWPSKLWNGHTQVDGQEHGNKVYYSCNPGYTLRGPLERTCDFGKWTGYKPSCVENYCARPSPLSAGVEISTGSPKSKYRHGRKLTMKCEDGYQNARVSSAAGEVWTCDNTTWKTEGKLICEPKPCRKLSKLKNGKMEFSGQDHGDSVYYTCTIGFRLLGDYQRTCSHGKWSGSKPRCSHNYCSRPSQLPDGVEVKNESGHGGKQYSHNQVVALQCKQGYRKDISSDEDVNSRWTCINGTWEQGRKLICLAAPCEYTGGKFEKLAEGTARGGTTFQHNAKIKITCTHPKQFVLKDSMSEAVCKYGKWEPELPTCVGAPCELYIDITRGEVIYPNHDTTLITRVVRHNVTATVECKEGYTRQGPKQLRCLYGSWRPSERPSCTPAPCPGFDTSGFSQEIPAAHEHTQSVVCPQGHHINPESMEGGRLRELTAVCNMGKWFPFPPECVADTGACTLPPNVVACHMNSSCNGKAVDHNVTVELSCAEGYKRKNDSLEQDLLSVTCSLGHWDSMPEPYCIPEWTPCEDPGQPKHANRTDETKSKNNTYYPEDMLSYECLEGYLNYQSSKEQHIFCNKNGTWSESPSDCIISEPYCLKPEKKGSRGFYTEKKKYSPGDYIIFYCAPGKKLYGEKKITCGGNGQWDESEPVCADQTFSGPKCPRLTWPKHGRMTTHPDKVIFKCNIGFDLVGSGSRTCLPTGEWSGNLTECIVSKRKCKVNKAGPNVRASYQDAGNNSLSVEVGDMVPDGSLLLSRCRTFSGYTFSGDSRRVCDEGSWTGRDAHCEIIYLHKEVTCPGVRPPDNGKMTGNSPYKINDDVRFVCNQGFTMEGSATLRCLSSGEWNGHAPSCRQVTCPGLRPPGNEVTCPGVRPPDNGKMTGNPPYKIKDDVRFVCNQGFTMEGSATLRCLSSGEWNGHAPSCRRKSTVKRDCQVKRPGQYVESVYRDDRERRRTVGSQHVVPHGTQMLSRCTQFWSFKFTGDSRRVCEDGEWSGTEPVCTYIDLTKGEASQRQFSPGHSVTVSEQGHLVVKQGVDLRLTCVNAGKMMKFSSPNGLDKNMKEHTPKPTPYPTPWSFNFIYFTNLLIMNIHPRHSAKYYCSHRGTDVPNAEFEVRVEENI